MPGKSRFVLVLLCLMCALMPQAFAGGEPSASAVDEVFTLLVSTPPWTMLGNRVVDDAKRKQIDETFSMVARYDDAVIRAAMVKYIDCSWKGGVSACEYEANLSIENLTVLNRFVFNVPERISREYFDEIPFYIGKGGSIDDMGVNMLWPLVVQENGAVALKALAVTTGGPQPNPLAEFDIFQKTFGRRYMQEESPSLLCENGQKPSTTATPVINAISRFLGVRIPDASPNKYNEVIFDALSGDTALPKQISQRASSSGTSDVLACLDFECHRLDGRFGLYKISFNAFLPKSNDCYLIYYIYLTYVDNNLTAVASDVFYFRENYATYISDCRMNDIAP